MIDYGFILAGAFLCASSVLMWTLAPLDRWINGDPARELAAELADDDAATRLGGAS